MVKDYFQAEEDKHRSSFIYWHWHLYCSFCLQLDIKLTDGGTPPLISDQTGRVNVRVTRNANIPQFQGEQPFEASVTEKQAPNTKIFQVRATDADPEVLFFLILYTMSPSVVLIKINARAIKQIRPCTSSSGSHEELHGRIR